MKKKINPELLKEELNKFRLLSEYAFYNEKKEIPEYQELIMGDEELDEAEGDDSLDDDANAIANDLGVSNDAETAPEGGEQSEEPAPDMGGAPEQTPAPEPAPLPAPAPEPANDDIEVDVTSLVKGSEEATKASKFAAHNTEILLQKLNDLESRVGNMDKISHKIDSLEQEMVKRNPTPVEKLEMRSLNSYPYTQKLTDYWADKEGPYDVMNREPEKKEYILTQDDIDSDYSENDMKQSFNINDDGEYDEEDI
jgi:hypothetical protein